MSWLFSLATGAEDVGDSISSWLDKYLPSGNPNNSNNIGNGLVGEEENIFGKSFVGKDNVVLSGLPLIKGVPVPAIAGPIPGSNPGAFSNTTSEGTSQPVSGPSTGVEKWFVSIIIGAVGLVLIIIGLIMLFQSNKTVQGVVKSAKSVAAVAA